MPVTTEAQPLEELRLAYLEQAAYLLRTARYLGVDERDLDDVVQEVFVIAHRRWNEFERRSSVRTFLYGICARVVLAYRRRAHRRREVPTGSVRDIDDSSLEAGQEGAERLRRSRSALLSALSALDEEKRLVIVLYELEDLSMEQVAAAAGCPVKTAYSRLYAARRILREILEGTDAEET